MSDPIVDEAHSAREAIAEWFNNDLNAISDDARKRQAAAGCKTVSFRPQLVKPEPTEATKKAG